MNRKLFFVLIALGAMLGLTSTISAQDAPTPMPESIAFCHEYSGGSDVVTEFGQQNKSGEFCQDDGSFSAENPMTSRTLGAGGGQDIPLDFQPYTDGSGDSFSRQWWWEKLCDKLPQQMATCAEDDETNVVHVNRALQPFEAANGESTDSLAWNLLLTVKCNTECNSGQVSMINPTHLHFANLGAETMIFELTVWQDTSCLLDPQSETCGLLGHPYWGPVASQGATANALFVNGRDVFVSSEIRSNVDGELLNVEPYNIDDVDYSTDCKVPVETQKASDDALAPAEWAVIASDCAVGHDTNFVRRWMPGTNLVYVYTITVPPEKYADWWIGQVILPEDEVVFGTDMAGPQGLICLAGETLTSCSNLSLKEYYDLHG